MTNSLALFIYLNVLDVGTTYLGWDRTGEMNPIFAWLFRLSPDHVIASMVAYKGVLLAFGAGLGRFNKPHILRALNLFMSGVVLWNLAGLVLNK